MRRISHKLPKNSLNNFSQNKFQMNKNREKQFYKPKSEENFRINYEILEEMRTKLNEKIKESQEKDTKEIIEMLSNTNLYETLTPPTYSIEHELKRQNNLSYEIAMDMEDDYILAPKEQGKNLMEAIPAPVTLNLKYIKGTEPQNHNTFPKRGGSSIETICLN